jgi:L-fuconolactonase
MIIDAHQHFWHIARGDYSWMDDSVAPIRRDFLPGDLTQIAATSGVTGTIVVQAAPTVAETQFLLGLAAMSPLILGVVGWVDLEAEDAEATLRELSQNRWFKGIRPMLQDIQDTQWILKPRVMKHLELAAELGLRMDALVTPRHLEAIAYIAQKIPTLPIVIDHCAKPVIIGGKDAGDAWRAELKRLGEFPNVFCKLSGLANEYGTGWSAQTLQPVFDHVVRCFSPQKMMWGSDWPVLNLAGDYANWVKVAQGLAADLTQHQQNQLFSQTALNFYDLVD